MFFTTILSVARRFSYKTISVKMLKNKLDRLKAEKISLMNLMKDLKQRKLNDGRISSLVYNIRMKHYKERINYIEGELSILEKPLKENIKRTSEGKK